MITRRHFLSSCAVTAATPGAVAAATITDPFNITVTTGLIPVNRTTLWQPGVTYNTIPGASSPGIPNRTTIYKTLSPLGGGRDDGAQINAAMASCPPNQVVQLTAGVFNLLTNINSRTGNITLRGVGPGKGLATGNGGVFVPDPTATQLYYGNTTQAWGPPVTMNGNDTTQTYSISSILLPMRSREPILVRSQATPALWLESSFALIRTRTMIRTYGGGQTTLGLVAFRAVGSCGRIVHSGKYWK
jgi:hypothetical protein